MFQRGWFHIDVTLQAPLEQVLGVVRQYGPARVQSLSEQVIDDLGCSGRFAGLIVQVQPQTSAWIARALDRAPSLPTLALLETPDPAAINALHTVGAVTALLPLSQPILTSFVQRALTHNFVPSDRVARIIARMAESRRLTAREVQLLGYCLGDEPRARVRRRLGITENTLKTQVRGLLRKCGERNLDSLAKNVLRSALVLPTSSSMAVAVDNACAAETQPLTAI